MQINESHSFRNFFYAAVIACLVSNVLYKENEGNLMDHAVNLQEVKGGIVKIVYDKKYNKESFFKVILSVKMSGREFILHIFFLRPITQYFV